MEYASTHQGYSEPDYDALLQAAGFCDIERFDGLCGDADTAAAGLFVLAATR